MHSVRRAEKRDIPAILNLLVQVDMVHHNGRPDLFKGPATKYSAEELEAILADAETPVFVCTDSEGRVQRRPRTRSRILRLAASRKHQASE